MLVKFKIDNSAHLGDRTEAAVKTKSLLGAGSWTFVPRGDGELTSTIPIERTTPPYQLSDALGDLATTVNQLNTGPLSQSLATLAETFANTPPDLKAAVHGVSRFSQSLNHRDAQLRTLLSNANKTTKVLAKRTDQVVTLINDTNALLVQLRSESGAFDQVSVQSVAMFQQLQGFVAENSEQFKPAVDKLNGVLAIVANRKERLQEASSDSTPTRCHLVSRCPRRRSSTPTSPTCSRTVPAAVHRRRILRSGPGSRRCCCRRS